MCPLRSGLQRHILYLTPGLHVLSRSRRTAGPLEPKCLLELISLPAGYSLELWFEFMDKGFTFLVARTDAAGYKAFPSYLILTYFYQYLINAPRLSLLLHEMDVMDSVNQTSLSTFVRWLVPQHYV